MLEAQNSYLIRHSMKPVGNYEEITINLVRFRLPMLIFFFLLLFPFRSQLILINNKHKRQIGNASPKAHRIFQIMWFMFYDNNNKSHINMYVTHCVCDTAGGANGSCQESLTRSAFNRWVSGFSCWLRREHVQNKSNKALNYRLLGSLVIHRLGCTAK